MQAMALFGLGRTVPPRVGAGLSDTGAAVSVAPATGNVIRAHYVIVSGVSGGVFVYNGTPGRGNPPVAWVSRAAADLYGNALPSPGIGSSNGGQWTAMVNAIFRLSNASYGPGQLYAPFPGQANLASPVISGTDTAALLQLISAQYASAAAPQAVLNAALTTTAGTPANPTLVTTDAWHSLGALAGGSGYVANVGRYQLLPDGFYEIDVALTAGAATVAGNYGFANSLPAAPGVTRVYPLGYQAVTLAAGTNNPSVVVGATVSVNVPAFPNGTRLSMTQRFPVN